MNKFAQVLLLVFAAVSFPAMGEDTVVPEEYQPGHGWKVPGTGFRLGGYASVDAENDKHAPAQLDVSNLSLFVWWEGDGRLKLFSEIDLEDAFVIEDERGLTTRHAYLALERAYADYLFSERFNLRAGKFLTPIGRWNVLHAQPLVWTTTRPLITERTFPTNATGIMAYGSLPVADRDIDYSVYSAVGEDWRPDPKLDPFEEAYGMHINVPVTANTEVGFSYANFEQKESVGERKNLVGFDYLWARNRYEISAELAYRFSDEGSQSDEKGLFVQGVIPLFGRWYALGRYEWYNPAGIAPAMNVELLGLAMRISPALVFKAEYSHASNNRIQAPEGLFTSFSILF